MNLVQRSMFYRLLALSASAIASLAVVVLLITMQKLLEGLVHGALTPGRFAVALASLLPMILYLVGPLAVATAIGFSYHRWSRDNELTALRMAGFSQAMLARPALYAAAAVALFTGVMSLYILPISFRIFEDIIYAAAHDVPPSMLEEGSLQSVAPDISLAFRRWVGRDAIEGVTILDGRPGQSVTPIAADRGYFSLARSPTAVEWTLVLESGVAFTRDAQGEPGNAIQFDRLVFPLSRPGDKGQVRPWHGFFEEDIFRLLDPPPEARLKPAIYGQWIAEGNKRLVMPLLCFSYAVFALGMMMPGKPPRVGLALRPLALAVGIGFTHGAVVLTHALVAHIPELAPIYYLTALVPAAAGLGLLSAGAARSRARRTAPLRFGTA